MANSTINIMYMIDLFEGRGGTENHLTYLVRYLDRERFSPCVVVFDLRPNRLVESIEEARIPVLHIPVGRYYTGNALAKALVLRGVIREKKIDIVQTFHFKSDTYGAVAAHLAGVRHLVSSKRDTGDLKSRLHFFIHKYVNRYIDNYIFVADAVGRIVIEREKITRGRFKTIYNGVDLKRFQPAAPEAVIGRRRELGIGADDFVVGTVAWFRREKNYDVFFDAIESMSRKIKNIKVVVVGGDNLLEFYKARIRKTGLQNHVLFAGPCDDVRRYLTVLDVACLVPGRNEGFSNSILEKMATGLPLVVSRVGGNAEAIKHQYNGFVIPPNDSGALADALLQLYRNPELRRTMGRRSRQRAEEKFSLRKMIRQHEEYYEEIMNGRS